MKELYNKYTTPPSLFEVVKKNLKKLFVITISILIIAIIMVLLKPRTYTSTSTLLFPSMGGKLSILTGGGGGGDLPSLPMMEGAILVPQPGSGNSTAITLINSVRARKLILAKMKAHGYDLKVIWKNKTTDSLYKSMDKLLDMSLGKNNELFLTASSKIYQNMKGNDDNNLAFNYIQSTLEALEEITSELPLDPAKQGEKYLKEQIVKTSSELEIAANLLKDYQKKNLLIDPTGQAKALADRYASVKSSSLETKIQADLAMRQLHNVSVKTEELVRKSIDPVSINTDVSGTGNGNSSLSVLYVRVTNAESELALLKLKLRDAHPDVINKKAELNEIKSRLKNEMKRQLGLVREGLSPGIYLTATQALVAQAKLSGYKSAEDELKKQIEKMPEIALNYTKLLATVTEKTNIITLLKTEYEKARVVAETRGPSYIVLDEPQQTNEPDSRGGTKMVAIALVLAMLICTLITYLEWMKYQPEEEIKGE